jgi:hypothetical protein
MTTTTAADNTGGQQPSQLGAGSAGPARLAAALGEQPATITGVPA